MDLDKNPNIKGIFEGGLRPWRVWGMEARECEVRPAVTATFKVGGVLLPPLKATWRFRLNGDGKMRVVMGSTEDAWTAAEAYQNMASWEKLFGGDPAAMKKFLDGYPETSSNGDMWGRRMTGAKKETISWGFMHSMQPAKPFLVEIYMSWNYKAAQMIDGPGPLQPPPGYEDFDMRPHQARGWDHLGGPSPPGSSAVKTTTPALANGSPAGTDSPGTRSPYRSWLWLLLLLPLAAAATLYWKLLHRPRTPE